jgi:putative transcriptional regulator
MRGNDSRRLEPRPPETTEPVRRLEARGDRARFAVAGREAIRPVGYTAARGPRSDPMAALAMTTKKATKSTKKKRAKRKNVAAEFMEAMAEAVAIAEGRTRPARVHVVPVKVPRLDVRLIRQKTGLSQNVFAARFGFSPGTVREWEQRRRVPTGPARVLLFVIDREPEAVLRALAG